MATLQEQQAQIEKAAALLKEGDVIGMPTETVYGLAAHVYDVTAIKKIFETKKRPFFDPLIVHIGHMTQMVSVVKEFPELAQFLAEHFWPGPLTMVLPKGDRIHSMVTSGLPSVGVRFPKHPMAQKIINHLGAPVAAPSANLFGKTSPTTAAHVQSEFPKVFVVDGGSCEVGLESTVVGFDPNNQIVKIHRPGAITKDMLEKVLQNFNRKIHVIFEESNVAPGHLKHHYMPQIPLVILENQNIADASQAIQENLKLENLNPAELVLAEDPVLAARELYANLRMAAESGANFIFVKKINQTNDLWTAIWDRIEKAATVKIKD